MRRNNPIAWTAFAVLAAVVVAPQVRTEDESAAGGEGGGGGGDDEAAPEQRLPRTRVVRTKYGQVQGRVVRLDSEMAREVGVKRLRDVEIYQGIRYATPPVGNHR